MCSAPWQRPSTRGATCGKSSQTATVELSATTMHSCKGHSRSDGAPHDVLFTPQVADAIWTTLPVGLPDMLVGANLKDAV